MLIHAHLGCLGNDPYNEECMTHQMAPHLAERLHKTYLSNWDLYTVPEIRLFNEDSRFRPPARRHVKFYAWNSNVHQVGLYMV